MCGAVDWAKELVKAAKKCSESHLEHLYDVADSCPACILTGIVQSKLKRPPEGMHDAGFWFNFDYKKAKAEWWAIVNEERSTNYYHI